MLRLLLTIILPVLLPLLLYFGYIAMMRRRAQAHGQETLPEWHEGPWVWVAAGGVVLMLGVLVAVRVSTGVPPGTVLEPPRMIDGEIVPSHRAE